MKAKTLLLRMVALVAAVMSALGASAHDFTSSAPESYTCYTPSNSTLTFYYDNQRSTRQGTTYDLNTGTQVPDWHYQISLSVTKVVFDPSFAAARPKTTCGWFYGMEYLESISGMSYLNTSEVTNMIYMFARCLKLPSLDVSHFNTSKVTSMAAMFGACWELMSLDLSSFNTSLVTDMDQMFLGNTELRTIYVGSGWTTAAVTNSNRMFYDCGSLVGGQGTTYSDSNPQDKTYAHIDGGPSNPGYFTNKNASLRGDVDGDQGVTIADVSALIDYLLTGDGTGLDLTAANCNNDSEVNIADVSALIDYLLKGIW